MMKCYMETIKEYAIENNIEIYVVGGAVRDRMINREISDLDFAVSSDCHKVARDIGIKIRGSYVNMHENTARVVLGEFIFDFSNFKGGNIGEDLLKRDFTVNSIAVDVKTDRIIDVSNGLEDLKKGIIRATYKDAFKDDPIRLLRAVRLCGELNYKIEENTKSLIRGSSQLLKTTAGERIIDELFKIFSLSDSNKYIELMDELGLLKEIFPIAEEMKSVGKCDFHTVDSYTHSLLTLKSVDNNLTKIIKSKWGTKIEEHFSEGVGGKTRLSIFKLGAFLHDIGKPSAMKIEGDKVSFKGHDLTGGEEFKKILNSLPMSSGQIKIIEAIITGHMKVLGLYKTGAPNKDVFNFFKEYRENALEVVLVSLFDFIAKRELLDEDESQIEKYCNFSMILIDKYYANHQKNYKIISGNEIMALTGAKGIEVGRILGRLEEEIFAGNIKTNEEAIEFVKKASPIQ